MTRDVGSPRTLTMVSGPTPSHSRIAPFSNREATSVRGSTRTSPWRPCGAWIWPTTSASSLSVDLEVDLGAIARRHHLHERAERLGDAATAADDLADVVLGDLQVQLHEIAIELLGHHHRLGCIHEVLRDVLDESPLVGRALGLRCAAHRTAGGTSASGSPLRTRSMRAVAVGRAPLWIQWRARSALTTRSTGSV